jgi:hypothetical protein
MWHLKMPGNEVRYRLMRPLLLVGALQYSPQTTNICLNAIEYYAVDPVEILWCEALRHFLIIVGAI